jgi:peptidoglycan/xylan/chitin deacetylase (PgdA/CDA1 family)
MGMCAASRRPRRAAAALVATAALAVSAGGAAAGPAAAPDRCRGTLYLTFDTGSQSQAQFIADTLRKHAIRATFFMANEKTVRGDWSLDPSWAPFWKARVAEGHAFGTHTFDHVYWQRDEAGGKMLVKPQFGAQAGKRVTWTAQQYCGELRRVDTRFQQLTGHRLDPYFRAPGGHTSPNVLAAGKACGYRHVGWAKAGFSGDETPSETYPNAVLLKRALDNLKDGDIVMAHLGIWSRKDPWAPADLEPLIVGLEQKGYCFATLREHPDYRTP